MDCGVLCDPLINVVVLAVVLLVCVRMGGACVVVGGVMRGVLGGIVTHVHISQRAITGLGEIRMGWGW